MADGVIAIETRKARKQHTCHWCELKIEPGETYERRKEKFEGDIWELSCHPRCAEFVRDHADDCGHDIYEGVPPFTEWDWFEIPDDLRDEFEAVSGRSHAAETAA